MNECVNTNSINQSYTLRRRLQEHWLYMQPLHIRIFSSYPDTVILEVRIRMRKKIRRETEKVKYNLRKQFKEGNEEAKTSY